jgi:hypothetical protein
MDARPMAHVLAMGDTVIPAVAHMGVARACDALVYVATETEKEWRSPRLERAVRLSLRCRGLARLFERDELGVWTASADNVARLKELNALLAERDRAYAELSGTEAMEYLRRCRQVD